MINFEHARSMLQITWSTALEQVASDRMRPFTREVDEHEHQREPEEYINTMWEVLKMTGGARARR